jgi:two-component system OmpR family sensor kinase
VRAGNGDVACTSQQSGFDTRASPPRLPAVVAAPDGPRYFTVSSEDGTSRYRVRASNEPHSGATVIVATSLADVDATLRRLLLIELLVTGAVVAGLAALGLWVVRLGLRPLDAIGKTAEAIAAGDLTRRVERAESRTEVGRLGLALNTMLGQIESAFTAKDASERRLRRFVADASHELRTPLAAVRAYAELFSRGAAKNPDDLERSMSGIRRESERMSVLVDDLLLLARLDEGRPLDRAATALDGVVGEAVDAARALDPDRPIRTEIEPALVEGDRDRLRQALDNLLANVRAHTPAGTPVDIRLSRADDVAVLDVADQGPGLAPEDEQRVFERFYRADPSRSRASGGVGLGLSIVAAIVAAHGGRVRVASGAASGTTFSIELPLSPAS